MTPRHLSLRELWVWAVVFVLAVAVSPAQKIPQQTRRRQMTLRGHVKAQGGRLVPVGVTVTLKTEGGIPIVSRPADSNGDFEFANLAAGSYTFTAKANGFQEFEKRLDLTDGWISYRSINVTLVPTATTKVNASDLPPMTDLAAPNSARREFEKGKRAWQKKHLKKARNHLERAVQEFPCYARAQAALAEIDLAEHQLDSAETNYKMAIRCDSTYLDAFSALAQLYMTENKPRDSEEILSKALRLAPDSWFSHYQLATAYFALGEYQKASHSFVTAESLHPDMPGEFHVKLANTYMKTGEYSKALGEMDTYLRLEPNGRYAASARKISAIMRKGGVTEPEPPASSSPSGRP